MSNQPLVAAGREMRRARLIITLATPVTQLMAHPGHDHPPLIPPEQPAHWFFEPGHLFTWLAAITLIWTLRTFRQKSKRHAATLYDLQR